MQERLTRETPDGSCSPCLTFEHAATIPPAFALFRISEQRKYWKDEYNSARREFDSRRMLECRRSILQCDQVIDTLEQAVCPEGSDDADYRSFFI
jgi:hypothetical protein